MRLTRKYILFALALLLGAYSLLAQDTTSFVTAPRERLINDYSMIGVNYGVTFSNTYFTPLKHGRTFVYSPDYISVTYTKYSKMFDTLPYFGLVIGFARGHEGYEFKTDPLTGNSNDVNGAQKCLMEVFEIPAMAQIHVDSDPMKFMADVGVYGGWRKSITRSGAGLDEKYTDSFMSFEHQIDYGLQGGAGFALMFDPVEIHFNCLVRWSWSNLYNPDYASQYYYRYAYPIDIMATVGIHFQLTKRRGRTNAELRSEAYQKVYGTTENNSGKSR